MPTENCSYSFWVGHFSFRRLFWLSCTFSIVTHLNRMYTKCDSIGGPISKFTIPTVSTIQCVIVCTNTFDGQPNHWTVSGFCFREINHFFNNWTMKCLFPCTTISLKCRWFFFLASFLSFPLSIYHFSFLQPFLAPVYTLSLSLFNLRFTTSSELGHYCFEMRAKDKNTIILIWDSPNWIPIPMCDYKFHFHCLNRVQFNWLGSFII